MPTNKVEDIHHYDPYQTMHERDQQAIAWEKEQQRRQLLDALLDTEFLKAFAQALAAEGGDE